MTPNQFKHALDRLGLSQLGAAKLFDANDRTVRRWAIGERSVPTGIAILLRLMLKGKVSADDIKDAHS